MNFEKQNKLPEGVGKKIIEALKTNKESSIDDVSDFETQNQNNYAKNSLYSPHQEIEYKNYACNYEINTLKQPYLHEEYMEQKVDNKDQRSVDTLIDLVTKLPPGVTKQTGAQIIRHTMEAMGIPMNKVLANAQMAQEELEQEVKNNVNVIEEYRAKIKILEQEIQQFRKKAHDLEDIISLFILSENNKK